MAPKEYIPLIPGGEYTSGDPGLIPDGYVATMLNMLRRPGPVWVKRPPLTKDNGTTFANFAGYAMWDDTTNQVPRLVAFNTNGANVDIYVKDTSGDAYTAGAVTGTNVTGNPTSFANFHEVLYYCVGSGTPVLPKGIFSYDGTSVKTNPLGGETLYSLTLASFVDRLILGYVRASVVNQLGTTTAYDSTSWISTSATTENLVSSTSTISRVTPTATTGSKIEKGGVYTIAASATDTNLVFRSDLRNTSPTFEMPMTIEIFIKQVWAAATVYVAGTLRAPTTGNGFRYRVTVGGTSAAVTEPTWPTTVGTTVVDNGVTWVCDGKDALASQPLALYPASQAGTWSTFWCQVSVPPMPAATNVAVRIKFGTDARPTYELASVDISLKDGVTDGVLTKKNYGQQLTVGKFFYPFFNQQSSATAVQDLANDIYWTETSDKDTILGKNYYRLTEAPGKVRAMAVVSKRLIVFKQRGMWVFTGTNDPNNPLLLEQYVDRVGCIGPRALTVYGDTLYFMDENGVYSFKVGQPPVELLGDALRTDFITNQIGALGALSAGGSVALAIDPIYKDLYVPGATKWYTYNLDGKTWSEHKSQAPSGLEAPRHFIWNPTTASLYGSTAGGAPFVMNFASTDAVDVYNGTTGNVTATITYRPMGAVIGRSEVMLDEVGVWGFMNNPQTANTFTVTVTEDFITSKTNSVRLLVGGALRTAIPLRQSGVNHTISFSHVGKTGSQAFQFARAEAVIRKLGPERVKSLPVQGSSSL